MRVGGTGRDEPVAVASEARVGVAEVRNAPAVCGSPVTERETEGT